VSTAAPVEFFPALTAASPNITHGFTGRVPSIDVNAERKAALARLEDAHAATRAEIGLGKHAFITAEQVHGAEVAIVESGTSVEMPGVDGLITAAAGTCLGIHVADCGPVYVIDPVRRVVGLLHSGRKGTEQGITTVAIRTMQREFGCVPAEMIVQLGPCIRPPFYETDFAAEILRQAREAGVREVHDCGTCTGANVSRYYSYRVEKGRTGRMLALLALG
jgi:copper oxidase (laccase) domain-containing protein